MLVAISTDFKDSAWSFSSLLKIHISADLHTIRDHIVVSDRPVFRRRERKREHELGPASWRHDRSVNIYTRPSRWPWKSSVAVVLFGSTRRRCISRHASPSKSSALRLIRSFNESRWPSFHVFAEERFDGFVLSSFMSGRKEAKIRSEVFDRYY